MNKVWRFWAATALLGLASACTTFQVSGVQMNRETPSYQRVGEFETSLTVNEFIGSSAGANLFNATATAMDTELYDAIRREIQKLSGDAAVNVQITYEAGFLDILLNGITFGIYAPATATVSGTVIKFQ